MANKPELQTPQCHRRSRRSEPGKELRHCLAQGRLASSRGFTRVTAAIRIDSARAIRLLRAPIASGLLSGPGLLLRPTRELTGVVLGYGADGVAQQQSDNAVVLSKRGMVVGPLEKLNHPWSSGESRHRAVHIPARQHEGDGRVHCDLVEADKRVDHLRRFKTDGFQ